MWARLNFYLEFMYYIYTNVFEDKSVFFIVLFLQPKSLSVIMAITRYMCNEIIIVCENDHKYSVYCVNVSLFLCL